MTSLSNGLQFSTHKSQIMVRTTGAPGRRGSDTNLLDHGLHDISGLLHATAIRLAQLEVGRTNTGAVEIPEEVLREIAVLRSIVARMAAITISLRQGTEIADLEVFNLGDLVHEVIYALTSDLTRFIDFEFSCSEEVLINADKTALWRAFHNVIKNAIDVLVKEIAEQRLERGRIQVNVALDMEDHAANISIKDNGPGIPEHIKDRLFENGVTTKEGGGRGFGLARTADAITQHQGEIEVSSQPGSTVFSFKIPQGNITPIQGVKESNLPEMLKTRTQYIMLDDESLQHELLCESLKHLLGDEVSQRFQGCSTTQQLAELLEQCDDWLELVLILDGKFPNGTPQEAVDLIKQKKPNAKVIFSSGDSSVDKVPANVDATLPKPFTLEKLIETLSSLNFS